MLTLRAYRPEDAAIITSWVKDEVATRRWSADRYDSYPVTAEDMNHKYIDHHGDCAAAEDFHPFTMEEDGRVAGHLILRYTDSARTVLRVGFVIVDDARRGRGLGRELMRLALRHAFGVMHAVRVTLGVFDKNPAAYGCYKAVGFRDVPGKESDYAIMGETWHCVELAMEAGDPIL